MSKSLIIDNYLTGIRIIRIRIESRSNAGSIRPKGEVRVPGDGRTGGEVPTVRELDGIRITGDVLCVLGSAAADPGFPVCIPAAGELREVILGFVREGGHSRWLTDPEISAGVLKVLRSGKLRSVVATLTPWSERP